MQTSRLVHGIASIFLLTSAAHAGFYGIGNNTAVSDMTGDGSVVSGYSGTPGGLGSMSQDSGYTWTAAQGRTTDSTTVAGQNISSIWGIANGGTSYAGNLADGSAFIRQGSTYTRVNPGTGGYQEGIYMSKDGSTVAGYNYNWDYSIPASPVDHSAGWVWKNGALQSYALPAGKSQNDFYGVSHDGTSIIGFAGANGTSAAPYWWNAAGT